MGEFGGKDHFACGIVDDGEPSGFAPRVQLESERMEFRFSYCSFENLATGMFDVSALDPGDVAGAIRRAVTDEHVSRSARYWQREVSEEEGVAGAADLIEAHWRYQLGQLVITGLDASLSPW